MPRGGNRCNKERLRRYELFDVLLEYAKAHNGGLPSKYQWWKLVVQAGYKINWSNFRYHALKLEDEGYIQTDAETSAMYIPSSIWDYIVHNPPVHVSIRDPNSRPNLRRFLPDLLRWQNNKCWWCGRELDTHVHVDHRIPRSKGGSDNIENLCAACAVCNLDKNDKMPWEFNGRLL